MYKCIHLFPTVTFEKLENLADWFHTLCSGSFHIQKRSCFGKGEGLGCSVTAKE